MCLRIGKQKKKTDGKLGPLSSPPSDPQPSFLGLLIHLHFLKKKKNTKRWSELTGTYLIIRSPDSSFNRRVETVTRKETEKKFD